MRSAHAANLSMVSMIILVVALKGCHLVIIYGPGYSTGCSGLTNQKSHQIGIFLGNW